MALWGKQDALAVTGTTIGVTNASAAVTGIGTAFTTQMKHGDTLIIDGVKYKVLSITSDTALTLSSVYEGSTDAELVVASVKIQQSPKFLNTTEKRSTLGIDSTESQAGGDNVTVVAVASGGSRYRAAPTVTFSGGSPEETATATASFTANGPVTSIAVTNVGSGYTSVPTVTIAKPHRNVNAASVTIATEQFEYGTHGLVAAEEVKYFDAGGTAVTGLTDETSYYVSALGLGTNTFRLAASAAAAAGRTNLAGVAISGTGGQFTCTATTLAVGDHIVVSGTLTGTGTITGYTTPTIYEVSAVTGTSPSVTGFTLTTEAGDAIVTTAGTTVGLSFKPYTIVMISGTGNNDQYFEIQAEADQATAVADLGSGEPATITNPGWVLKTVGTGGRAGRVQYETLVAGRSLITGDAADDLEAPDA
jgi:hypothetical protein